MIWTDAARSAVRTAVSRALVDLARRNVGRQPIASDIEHVVNAVEDALEKLVLRSDDRRA